MTFNILYCSDLHGNKRLYEKLIDRAGKKDIHAIIIGGDICPHARGPIDEAAAFQKDFLLNYFFPLFKNFKDKNNKDVFLMMGNDDFRVNMDVLEKREKQGLFILVHNKVNTTHNKKIVGYSFVSQMPFLLKDWEKMDTKDSTPLTDPAHDILTVEKAAGTIQEDLEKLKKLSDPKKTIYAIHCPPFNSNLDMLHNKQHVGSTSVRTFIEDEQPFLTLHGHIHESPIASGEWKDTIGKTICINCGSEHLDNILNIAIIDIDNLENIEYDML